ncbi:MAG: hypothetical protein ACK46A_09515 [Akkermansiaceae bacterium]|jgi:hypothetical protein|nr:hypothetical protein [Luteolibacter sp.]
MSATLPIICATLLAGIAGAGLSHYWSVRTLLAMNPQTQDATQMVSTKPPVQNPAQKADSPFVAATYTPETHVKSQSQEAFFNELLAELKQLKNENRDLRDLMGETNRDIMKLSFRVDTHSESFRPLPTSEERQDTSFNFPDNSQPGVLPPRATPVMGFDE